MDFKFKVGLSKKKSLCLYWAMKTAMYVAMCCISGVNVRSSYMVHCESRAVDLWHSSRDLLAAAKKSRHFLGCRAPSIESERRSP